MRALLVLATGCGWFDKGNDDEPRCIEDVSIVGFDETTAVGFSASDVVANVGGEKQARLTWAGDGASDLTLSTAWDGGEARFVDVSPNPDWSGIGPDTGAESCRDRVEVDVAWTFATDDGAFDEADTVALQAETSDDAVFSARINQQDLGGTYRIPDIDPSEYDEVYLSWYGSLRAAETDGHVGGTASGKDEGGGVSSGVGLEVASWEPAGRRR